MDIYRPNDVREHTESESIFEPFWEGGVDGGAGHVGDSENSFLPFSGSANKQPHKNKHIENNNNIEKWKQENN